MTVAEKLFKRGREAGREEERVSLTSKQLKIKFKKKAKLDHQAC